VDFWQQGNELWGSDSVNSPSGRRFTRNLRYVAFTYYDTMDDSSMGVNLCFQKQVMRMFGDQPHLPRRQRAGADSQ
jgi:hypothetical protein